jgi:predicted ArsR family transcriptional regulator
MALDNERNRVLAALRDQPAGANSAVLGERLGLGREAVERHLLYCADYGLATWRRVRNGSGDAVITERGRDYLLRQGR